MKCVYNKKSAPFSSPSLCVVLLLANFSKCRNISSFLSLLSLSSLSSLSLPLRVSSTNNKGSPLSLSPSLSLSVGSRVENALCSTARPMAARGYSPEELPLFGDDSRRVRWADGRPGLLSVMTFNPLSLSLPLSPPLSLSLLFASSGSGV